MATKKKPVKKAPPKSKAAKRPAAVKGDSLEMKRAKRVMAEMASPKKNDGGSRFGIRFMEQGSEGLHENFGFITEAYNAQLFWPTVQPLYSRLRRSMAEIVMIRTFFTSWARNVKPIVELPDDATDDDRNYQDFIESDFDNMDGGFDKFIDTLVNQVPFMGWGWWEIVSCIRDPEWNPPGEDDWKSEEDDGLIGIRRLAWRDSSTFSGWDMTEKKKKLRGLKQRDYPHDEITLPLKKNGLSVSLHITYGDPNNPEGLTPLEAAWRLERLKYGYEVVHGIGSEHAAGHLKINKTSEGDLSAGDQTMIEETANNLGSAQEGNYGYFPFGMDGDIIDVPFAAAMSILERIKSLSIEVLSLYGMQFIALNTMTSTGAQASQVDSTDTAVFTFNSMMDGFASQYDQQVGKRLYALNKDNFPGMSGRPKIRFSHIDRQIALDTLSNFVRNIDGIVPLGDDDYKEVRRRSGFLPVNTTVVNSVKQARTLDQKSTAVEPGKKTTEPAKIKKPTKAELQAREDDELIELAIAADFGGGSLPRGSGAGTSVSRAVSRTFSTAFGAGGITIKAATGDEPKEGYVVATHESKGAVIEKSKSMTREDLEGRIFQYYKKHKDVLDQDGYYLGLWFNKDTGNLHLDIAQVETDKDVAIKLGIDHDQIAIWDIKNKNEIQTGGTGKKGDDG